MDAPPPSPGGASLAPISTAAAPVRKPETKAPAEKCTGSGSLEKCTGSGSALDVPQGCPLPPLLNIQWEGKRDRPGWYCWDAPAGAKAHRNTKTYLGYVGRKLLSKWKALPEAKRLAAYYDAT
jgi:hypothetical protein